MEKGRRAGREIPSIIIGLDVADSLSSAKAGARRAANGAVGIGRIKTKAASRKRIEVGGLNHRVAITPEISGGQLVRHDEEDIRGCIRHGVKNGGR
jgi:hypothetical protein